MKIVAQLDTFHRTALGYGVFGVVELGLSYLFASLAINSGSLFQWSIAIILLVGVLQNFTKLILMGVRRRGDN